MLFYIYIFITYVCIELKLTSSSRQLANEIQATGSVAIRDHFRRFNTCQIEHDVLPSLLAQPPRRLRSHQYRQR